MSQTSQQRRAMSILSPSAMVFAILSFIPAFSDTAALAFQIVTGVLLLAMFVIASRNVLKSNGSGD